MRELDRISTAYNIAVKAIASVYIADKINAIMRLSELAGIDITDCLADAAPTSANESAPPANHADAADTGSSLERGLYIKASSEPPPTDNAGNVDEITACATSPPNAATRITSVNAIISDFVDFRRGRNRNDYISAKSPPRAN